MRAGKASTVLEGNDRLREGKIASSPLAKIFATEKFNSLFFDAICGRSDKSWKF
jgi:hypothetical protein